MAGRSAIDSRLFDSLCRSDSFDSRSPRTDSTAAYTGTHSVIGSRNVSPRQVSIQVRMHSGNMVDDSYCRLRPTNFLRMGRACHPILAESVPLHLEAKLSYFQTWDLARFGRHVRPIPRQSFCPLRVILNGPAFFRIEWFR